MSAQGFLRFQIEIDDLIPRDTCKFHEFKDPLKEIFCPFVKDPRVSILSDRSIHSLRSDALPFPLVSHFSCTQALQSYAYAV